MEPLTGGGITEMPTRRPTRNVNDELEEWNELGLIPKDCGLLLGNGASMAVWQEFRYSSLFERAKSPDIENELDPEDIALFIAMGTPNFEEVLQSLLVSGRVNKILSLDLTKIRERYSGIRQSLIDAVCAVHIPWRETVPDVLTRLGSCAVEYDTIFSTNYDLLVYWSLMDQRAGRFKDYFWNRKFDVSDTSLYGRGCRVLFLHGALHLYVDAQGNTWKAQNNGVRDLLRLFRVPQSNVRTTPLFITEGNAEQKLRAIQRSDYLYFAYRQFEDFEKPLVVLGHSLSEEDAHLLAAMSRWRRREIFVGIFSEDSNKIMEEKLRLEARLPRAALRFFRSVSHPLSHQSLRIVATAS